MKIRLQHRCFSENFAKFWVTAADIPMQVVVIYDLNLSAI